MDKKNKKKPEKSLLIDHPEVQNNARGYFHHENGKTIIEDRVPRGDADPYKSAQPMNNGDLTDDDFRDLAAYAADLIDAGIHKYDEHTAYMDALSRAINEKDGGKFAGKVNANSFKIILDHVGKIANKNPKEEPGQSKNDLFYNIKKKSSDYMETAVSGKKSSKEASLGQPGEVTMSRSEEIKSLEAKLASLKAEEAKTEMGAIAAKVASDPEARATFKKLMKEAMTGKVVVIKKDKDDDKKDKKDNNEDEACSSKSAADDVVSELDKIAGELESSGDFELFKVAYQLDQVADVLQGKKEAKTLESEPDESFMKKYFHAGKEQSDSDESKFMNEFDNDNTQEVIKQTGKSKTASTKRPYSIIRND